MTSPQRPSASLLAARRGHGTRRSLAVVVCLVLGAIGSAAAASATEVCQSGTDGAGPFSDVGPGSTFCVEISWLVSSGITAGRGDGSFGPGDGLTRGQMAAFLYRLEGEPVLPDEVPSFSDVPSGHVFAQEIAWLASAGITGGRGDGSFGPGDGLTRGQMAAFLYRFQDGPVVPGPGVMVSTWDTDLIAGRTIELHLAGRVDAVVDWGDGTVQRDVTGPTSHTYEQDGRYTVEVRGTFQRWGTSQAIPATGIGALVSVDTWSGTNTQHLASAFYEATNLVEVAEPPRTVIDMRWMFGEASTFNGAIGHWDTSNVTNMSRMFSVAEAFDQPIGDWDTSNVTDMSQMFARATSFDQPIGDWDTSSVTDLSSMFFRAASFDQPVGGWDISRVTDLRQVFREAESFDQPVGGWDTSSVTDMSFAFYRAYAFDQPLDAWDTSNVTTMAEMFRWAQSFNSPVGTWDTSQVTAMNSMFDRADAFNQPVGDWDVSNITDMSRFFFGAAYFDQPLADWDTSSVTDMSLMFYGAESFDQPIAGWDTSEATDMNSMFRGATVFDQPIGSWDTSKVTNMRAMFLGTQSFDQPLSAWDTSSVTEMAGMFLATGGFNQDLSSWCVARITSEPFQFDERARAWVLPRPLWGSCPT